MSSRRKWLLAGGTLLSVVLVLALRSVALRVLPGLLTPEGVEVTFEGLDLTLSGEIVTTGMRARWQGGSLGADSLRTRLSLRRPHIRALRVVAPSVVLVTGGGTSGGPAPFPRLAVGDLHVERGTVAGEMRPSGGGDPVSWRVEGLTLSGTGLRSGPDPTGRVDSVAFRATSSSLRRPVTVRASAELGPEGPDIDVRLASEQSAARFRGRGRWSGGLSTFARSFVGNLELSPVHISDLSPFVDAALPDGTLQGSLLVQGPEGSASGELALDLGDTARGSVKGRVEAGPGRAFRASVTATLRSERPERLRLPVAQPYEADFELELGGPGWSAASGRLSGRAGSVVAGTEATLDVRATSGRLDANVDVVVDGRVIGLNGASSLDDMRTWRISARAPGAGIEGTALVELLDHARVQARLTSAGPYLDSARISYGMERPGHVGAVAFNGPGTARLDARMEHDTLVVSELETSDWTPGPGVPGVWNARVRGWLSGSPATANGQLAVRVDSIIGGALDGVQASGEVSLVEGVAHVRNDAVRGADSVRAEGTARRVGDAWIAALTGARLRWETPYGPHTLTWRGLLELSPEELRGGGALDVAPATPSGTGWRGETRIQAVGGDLIADGRLDGPPGRLTIRATAAGAWSRPGRLDLAMTSDTLALLLGGAYPLRLYGGTLNVDAPRWTHPRERAEVALQAGGVGGSLAFDSVRARGRSTEDGAIRMRAYLYAAGLRAEGGVMARLAPDGTVIDSIDVTMEATETAALSAATTGLLGAEGTGRLRVRRRGGRLSLAGSLDLDRVAGRGWRSDRVTARADGSWSDVGIEGDFVAHAENAAALDGPPLELDARVRTDGDSIAMSASLGPDVRIHVAGPTVDEGISVQRGSLVVVRDTLVLESPVLLDLRGEERGLAGLSFVGAGASPAHLTVTGYARRGDRWNVEGAMGELPTPELLLWLPGVPVRDGRISGQGRLSGGAGASPRGEGSLRLVTPLRSGAELAVEASGGIDADWARVTIEALMQGRTVVADGAFPRREGVGDPRLEIRADSFPLDPLSDRGDGGSLRGGTVDGRLARVGPDGSAELEGSLRIQADSWDVPGADIRLSDFDASLTGSGPAVRVAATALEGRGSGSVEGTVGILGVPTPTVEARIHTDRFPLAWSPTLVIRTIGDLDVSGTVTRPRLQGDLQVESSEILLGGGTAEPIELTDQDRALLRERFGWRERSTDTGSWLPLGALDADLNLELGGDVWVRRWADPELALALSGSLQVRKESGQDFQYFGTLTPINNASGFRQFGRRFAVSSGSIELLGPLSAMEFTVEGRHEVPSRSHPGSPEAVIVMTVQGSADDMSVVLESEPALDQTDIVSYLLLGQPSDQVSSSGGTSAAEAGAGIALGRLSGLLGETASQTIGLDVVDLEPRGLGGVTLVVGRYLTPRLYVAVRQPVAWQPGTEATGFERLPSVEAELATARWLLFNLQGDAQGFGLRLRSRWGY